MLLDKQNTALFQIGCNIYNMQTHLITIKSLAMV